MKVNYFLINVLIALFVMTALEVDAQKNKKASPVDTLNYASGLDQQTLQISFQKGENFNHPTFSIWIEDLNGNYIESLYVTQYIATGTYGNADAGDGKWSDKPGESIRPAALPYWAYKRNVTSRDSIYVPTPENPVTDAITGATPTQNFVMFLSVDKPLPEKFKVMFEINQTWDWNDYWTNNKYPGDKNYQSSSQPSVVYEAELNLSKSGVPVKMKAIGHGHYSGKDGSLTQDLSTLTTALFIAGKIQVSIANNQNND